MSDIRMKTFDKCISELLGAITKDMIHVDNLKEDVKGVQQGVRFTANRKAKLEALRQKTLDSFKDAVLKEVNTSLKEKLDLEECFKKLDDPKLKKKNAWRINGDPQHDTFAQRRQVYLDYIETLSGAEEKLQAELEVLKKELSQ